MNRSTQYAACLLLAGGIGSHAFAQPPQHDAHPAHAATAAQHASPRTACDPSHAAMGHCTPASAATGKDASTQHAASADPHAHDRHDAEEAAQGKRHAMPTCTPEHAAMGHCTAAPGDSQEPREPIPVVTQADREAAFPVLARGHMAHGQAIYTRVKFNRFEAWDSDAASGQAWEGSASVGGDIHRLWLRSSGSRSAGRTTAANAELRWSRAVARWWDVVAGVRHDAEPGPSRTRGALGFQGIAPYQFEVSALAYFGEGGLAARLEAEYDMRFTNRLVLQPLVEAELHAQDDPARGIGSGLSKAEAGLRLRYEITRRFAPYVGVAHERTFGRTARFHEAEAGDSRETRLVAGVRFWF